MVLSPTRYFQFYCSRKVFFFYFSLQLEVRVQEVRMLPKVGLKKRFFFSLQLEARAQQVRMVPKVG